MFKDELAKAKIAQLNCLSYLQSIKEELHLDGIVVKINTGKVGHINVDTDTSSNLIFRLEYSNLTPNGILSSKPCWSLCVNDLEDEDIKRKLKDNFTPASDADIKRNKLNKR